MAASVVEAIRCPHCEASLDIGAPAIECAACRRTYPRFGRIPLLLSEPDAYLSGCRRQLANFEAQAERTVHVIEETSRAFDLLPLARIRCAGMIDAVRGQAADVSAILRPVIGNVIPDPALGADDDCPSPLKYIPYLYRDWGWPREASGENEQALAAVDFVRESRPLGRMLVLGAGACRLAYDLHGLDPAADTLVVDVDPLLFTAAETLIRGGTIRLREANAEIDELGRIVKEWTLTAPRGPILNDRFHFLLADGLEPPLAEGAFDTVLTPWFIDLVPRDLRDFMSTVYTLLKPGGQWLSLGPLRYTVDLPVGRRFTRDEVFDLAERAGFQIGRWRGETMPYLVSKLSGRGKAEWVLTFAATKRDGPPPDVAAEHGGPPAWMLFRHLPIQKWEGQALAVADDPLSQLVLSAIDGRRTLDDVTRVLASRIAEARVPRSELRAAVRAFLRAAHPECRGQL